MTPTPTVVRLGRQVPLGRRVAADWLVCQLRLTEFFGWYTEGGDATVGVWPKLGPGEIFPSRERLQ